MAATGATARQLTAVVLTALAVRVAWIVVDSRGPGEVVGDAVYYTQTARSLAAGGPLQDADGYRAVRMPLYPVFLSMVRRVAGDSVLAVQAAQAALGAATCALIVWGAGAWLPPGAALAAGWAAAFYFGLFSPSARVLTETLYAFLLAAFFAVWYRWRGRDVEAAALGAAGAALYLVRPEGLLAGAAAAAAGPYLRKGWRARHSVIVAACLAAAVLGWGLRNRAVLGTFLPGTTMTGFHLSTALPRTMGLRLGHGDATVAPATASGELERDREYRARALAAVKAAPPHKVALAWFFNVLSIYYPFLPGYDLTFVLLAPFVLRGLLSRRPEVLLPALLIAAWTALFAVAGGAESRYRQLLAPLLVWLAAAGWAGFLESRGPARAGRAVAFWAALNGLVLAFAPRARETLLWLRDLLWN